MRILKAQVNNYKSLKAVEVEFGKLTTLIGRNSSGKSNVLEALHLFFNEFGPALKRDITGVPDYLWHDREIENPIEFIVTVKLTKKEFDQIFTKDLSKAMKISFKDGKLTVCRKIFFKPPNTATWRTSFVALDNIPLIEDGKRVKRPSIPLPPPDTLTKLCASLSQKFKGMFKLVLTVRDDLSSPPQLGERSLNILPEIHTQLVATLDSDKLNDARLWDQIEKDVGKIPSLTRLHVRGGQLRNREGLIRFPLSYIGGGDQEILALIFMLRKEKAHIFAIEEPETHLHPNLSRTFFDVVKGVSKTKQLVISTHSPIFIDLANLNDSWIFRKENRETKVYRIQSEEDLRAINYELGIRPSDIFFADRILFVEGPIDKTVYRIWAEKLRIDLKSPTISVIPLRGKTKGKRHLQAWVEVTRNIPVSIFMILDKDAKEEADKLIEKNLIDRRRITVLRKGAIEDYYNSEVLIDVIKEKYPDIELTEKDMKPSQFDRLLQILGQKHRDWKIRSRAKAEIGEKVATRMSKEQIHDEVKRALERTTDYLEL